MRKIARKQTRTEPINPSEQPAFQREVNEDHLRYINELDQSLPDFRDKVTFVSDGSGKQRIPHGMKYTPQGIVSVRIVSDSEAPTSVWEYREADGQFLFLRTNAPSGAKISVVVSQV